MKFVLVASATLMFGQLSLASVLDKVAAGKYEAQCQQQDSQSPITFTAANISKEQKSLTVELLGSAYNGTVSSSVPLEFSKTYSKEVNKYKPSSHDNIVLPGTIEEHTIIKNSNEESAGIQETVKTKVGFITTSTKTSTTILSIQGETILVNISDSEGGNISCELSK